VYDPSTPDSRRRPAEEGARKLLAVVDFCAQPYSIGDLLIYMTGSLVAARAAGADKIDFCLVSDPDSTPADPIMARLVTRDNHYQHLMSLLPIMQLNPLLGAIHVFDSTADFHAYLLRNEAGSHLWPSRADLAAKKYMYYDNIKAIHRFHQRHSTILGPRFNGDLRRWVLGFFQRQAGARVPVSINLRNNPEIHAHRNSNLPAWKAFFETCNDRYPVQFIVTCATSEIDERIRACPNVVFAKDHHSSIIQDLALIHHSAFHMGASSGPATIPLLGTSPYHIFHCDMLPHVNLYEGAVVRSDEFNLRFAFAQGLQSFGIVPETTEVILHQFERIWSSRNWVGERSAQIASVSAGPH
jgi:hypothetical protein